MKYWVGFLTLAIAVLSLFVINAYCNDLEYSKDNAGVLISALGVLITFVVAWQIWQTIDAKNTVKDLKSDIVKLQTECLSLTNDNRNIVLGWYKCHFADILIKDGGYDVAYDELLSALNMFIKSSISYEDDMFQNCVCSMEACLEELESDGTENMAKRFCDKSHIHENEYRKIIDILNQRDSRIRKIKSEVKRLHKIRLEVIQNLNSKFNL